MIAKQTIIFIIVIAFAVFISMQVVYGQTAENNPYSTVTPWNISQYYNCMDELKNMTYCDMWLK